MEPMNLGSAPSSPASPMPSFLPNFLMGDNIQPHSFNTSPGRNKVVRLQSTPDVRPINSRNFNQSVVDTPSSQSFTPHKSGPPNQGLFDTMDQVRKSSPLGMNELTSPLNRSKSFSRIDDSINSSKYYDRSVASRSGPIDTLWVTVFGFPPSVLSLVLARFGGCGTIVEKKVPPQGNWMHLKYSSINDVAKALALNGRCIDNNTMVGVQLFYPKENKENDLSTISSTPIRARSLRQSYISPNTLNSVLPPQNVPQKSTGLVSKAMEYVFGW